MKVEPIKVFKIESESRHGQFYKVMYDGSRWYCECRSWQFNHEHKGEKDEYGKAVPRECKHTREAEHRMRTMGKKAFTVVELGPFNELQEYVGQLVEMSRNGQMSPGEVHFLPRRPGAVQGRTTEDAGRALVRRHDAAGVQRGARAGLHWPVGQLFRVVVKWSRDRTDGKCS